MFLYFTFCSETVLYTIHQLIDYSCEVEFKNVLSNMQFL